MWGAVAAAQVVSGEEGLQTGKAKSFQNQWV